MDNSKTKPVTNSVLISSAGITSPDEVPAKLVPSPVIELEPTKPWTVGLLENERQENLLLPKGPKEPSCPGTQRDNKAEVTGTGQEAGEKPIAPRSGVLPSKAVAASYKQSSRCPWSPACALVTP